MNSRHLPSHYGTASSSSSAQCIGISVFLLLSSLVYPHVQAQIAQPITSSGLNTTVLQNGTTYTITGGTRPGNGTNLFHSFGEFGVPASNIANFFNETPNLATSNILGRITGGNISNILGTIETTGFGNANLFLLNPAGIVFGPNATLNVGGSVTFSTADYIRLTDNIRFNAIPNAAVDALLSAAPVAAFGFLGSNPETITIQGSQLSVSEGQSISLVGGNITVQAGALDDGTVLPSRLSAPGGQINLASVASPGEVTAPTFLPTPGMTMGNILLSQGTIVDVSGDAAGTIRIRGGQFELNNAALNADTGNTNGAEAAIDILLTGDMFISSDSVPAMTARSYGDGNAGSISVASAKIQAVSLLPDDTALIDTHTEGAGHAGSVTLNTGEQTFTGNPGFFDFFIMSGTAGEGNGGSVTVNADNIHLESARIDTGDAILGGSGSGGQVTFTGRDMTFDFVSIVTDSHNARGGNILLSGRDITITNESSIGMLGLLGESTLTINARDFALRDSSLLLNQTALGTGGGTTLTVQNAVFTNGSRVASQTSGDADAGFIKLIATDDVTFSDTGNTLNPSGLYTNSLGNVSLGTHGNAGAIDVSSKSLSFTGGARLDSTTQTNGNGGTITVTTTDKVLISGERSRKVVGAIFGLGDSRASGIYSRTTGNSLCSGPCGNAGEVILKTANLDLANGGVINIGTSSTGDGGSATVHATGHITLSGTMQDGTSSGIFSRTIGTGFGSGNGGNIDIRSGQSTTISNGATISASSTGPGNAGNIAINAGQQFEMRNGSVKTEAALASGGNIDIQAIDRIRLVNSSISTSVLGGAGSGGNITIDPNVVILQNSQIIAQAVQGTGGNISITTPLFLADAGSLVDASSQFGLNGTVNIQSPTSNLAGTISSLPSSLRQMQSLQTGRCAALADSRSSSLIVAGRDILPAEPGGWSPSPFALMGEETDSLAMASPPVAAMIASADAPVSLRRLTPAGFLIQSFAENGLTGCRA